MTQGQSRPQEVEKQTTGQVGQVTQFSDIPAMGEYDQDAAPEGMGEHDDSGESSNDGENISREQQLKGADLVELNTECHDSIERIKALEGKRSEINAEIAAERAKMESTYGINRKALAVVLAVSKMTEDQMDGFDTSILVLRKSINQPMQTDLFKA